MQPLRNTTLGCLFDLIYEYSRTFMDQNLNLSPLHSIQEEICPKTSSKTYELAFADQDFLLDERTRPYRMMLEYLKPEWQLQELAIKSTLVVFGSARMQSKEDAKVHLATIQQAAFQNPHDETIKAALKKALKDVEKSHYYEQARQFAELVSKHNLKSDESNQLMIITGGGPGIMEAANRGAHEAGGRSIGLNITLPKEQTHNSFISPELNFRFHYFAIRKMHFLLRARALVFFPGGYGTLDELFESLTLMQTQKMSPVPVILFSKSYWEKLINFKLLIDEGAIDEEDIHLFQYAETAEETWQIIYDFYKINGF